MMMATVIDIETIDTDQVDERVPTTADKIADSERRLADLNARHVGHEKRIAECKGSRDLFEQQATFLALVASRGGDGEIAGFLALYGQPPATLADVNRQRDEVAKQLDETTRTQQRLQEEHDVLTTERNALINRLSRLRSKLELESKRASLMEADEALQRLAMAADQYNQVLEHAFTVVFENHRLGFERPTWRGGQSIWSPVSWWKEHVMKVQALVQRDIIRAPDFRGNPVQQAIQQTESLLCEFEHD
jgi:phage shock protein A